MSTKFRDEGNVCFRSKNYDRAIMCYGCSIFTEETDYHLAHQNRALIYYNQKKYELAIEDCSAAFVAAEQCGNQYYYKSLWTAARAYKALNDSIKAIQCIDLALRIIDKIMLSATERDTVKESIELAKQNKNKFEALEKEIRIAEINVRSKRNAAAIDGSYRESIAEDGEKCYEYSGDEEADKIANLKCIGQTIVVFWKKFQETDHIKDLKTVWLIGTRWREYEFVNAGMKTFQNCHFALIGPDSTIGQNPVPKQPSNVTLIPDLFHSAYRSSKYPILQKKPSMIVLFNPGLFAEHEWWEPTIEMLIDSGNLVLATGFRDDTSSIEEEIILRKMGANILMQTEVNPFGTPEFAYHILAFKGREAPHTTINRHFFQHRFQRIYSNLMFMKHCKTLQIEVEGESLLERMKRDASCHETHSLWSDI